MGVFFDPVLGELRKSDTADVVNAVRIDGAALAPDAGGAVEIPSATTARKGVVRLNASTSSASQAEAATPSAVRSAYNLAAEAGRKADRAAKLDEDNEFLEGNSFRKAPRVSNPGMVGLVFLDGGRAASLEMSFAQFVLDTGEYDPQTGEYALLQFSDWFSPHLRALAERHGTAPSLSAMFFDPWGSFSSVGLYTWEYDEAAGDYANVFWRNARIEFGEWNEWIGGDGAEPQVVVHCVAYDADAEDGEYLGNLDFVLTWTASPGGAIDAQLSLGSAQFWEEGGAEKYAWPDYESFPAVLCASTDPASPYFAQEYDDHPGEYGWTPAADSALSTEDFAASRASEAVAAHDSSPSAHPGMTIPASRISGSIPAGKLPVAKEGAIGGIKVEGWSAFELSTLDGAMLEHRGVVAASGFPQILRRGAGRVYELWGDGMLAGDTLVPGMFYTVIVGSSFLRSGITTTVKQVVGLGGAKSGYAISSNVDLGACPPPVGVYFVFFPEGTKRIYVAHIPTATTIAN